MECVPSACGDLFSHLLWSITTWVWGPCLGLSISPFLAVSVRLTHFSRYWKVWMNSIVIGNDNCNNNGHVVSNYSLHAKQNHKSELLAIIFESKTALKLDDSSPAYTVIAVRALPNVWAIAGAGDVINSIKYTHARTHSPSFAEHIIKYASFDGMSGLHSRVLFA